MDSKSYKDEALPPSSEIFHPKDWTKTMKSLVDLLRSRRGSTGLPLAWCVREDEGIANDPNPNAADHGWATVTEEMIKRARMKTPAGVYTQEFKADNEKVWNIINTLTRNLPCYINIEPCSASLDGRQAFLTLERQFLGQHHYDNQANEAQRILETTFYDGETRKFTFDTYVRIHLQQHVILSNLVKHGAHTGINETMKTRHFIQNIRAPYLQSAISVCMSNDDIKQNFDRCVAFFRDHVVRFGNRQSLQVAAVHTTTNGNIRRPPPIDAAQVVLRYYNHAEYRRFTPAARERLRSLRDAQDRQGQRRRLPQRKGNNKRQKTGNASSVSTQPDEPSVAPDAGDDSANTSGNRNNSNLTRQQPLRKQ
jgi:hypothetical protein